jgi:hypothetical protein
MSRARSGLVSFMVGAPAAGGPFRLNQHRGTPSGIRGNDEGEATKQGDEGDERNQARDERRPGKRLDQPGRPPVRESAAMRVSAGRDAAFRHLSAAGGPTFVELSRQGAALFRRLRFTAATPAVEGTPCGRRPCPQDPARSGWPALPEGRWSAPPAVVGSTGSSPVGSTPAAHASAANDQHESRRRCGRISSEHASAVPGTGLRGARQPLGTARGPSRHRVTLGWHR